MVNVYRKLILDIKKKKIKNQKDLNKLKTQYARKYKIGIPSNTELLNYATEKERVSLKHILSMKPVRTILSSFLIILGLYFIFSGFKINI